MSVEASTWVWNHSQSEMGARLVLLSLADHAGADGGDAWPSIARLVTRTNLSERAVQYALRTLEAIGEIEVDKGAGPKGTNRYKMTFATRGADIAPPADIAPDRVQSTPKGGATVAPEPTTEPSGEPLCPVVPDGYTKDLVPLALAALPLRTFPAEFEKTWLLYPVSRRGSKRKAYAAWRATILRHARTGREAQLEVMRKVYHGTQGYLASRAGHDDAFTKLAETFWGIGDHWEAHIGTAPVETEANWRDRMPRPVAGDE